MEHATASRPGTARIVAGLMLAVGMLAPAAAQPRPAPVATGEIAPDFELKDQEGRAHRLSAERGKRAVVLVFYRGHW